MMLQLHARSIRISMLCLLAGAVALSQGPLCRGESARHMEKRIHKVEKKLAEYQPGTYVRLVFLDHSQSVGTVGRLGADSFAFTDADTNMTQSYAYADVARIKKGDTYVGEGSVRRHFPRLLFAGLASAAAAGVIAAFTTQ